VGRGGAKLEAALDRFGIDVAGRTALDAGASTGGFTDCLLQAGAARVVAVDVGRAQLHERLRADERVESLEQTDVRTYAATGRRFPVVVCDLSFISLRTVAGALVELTEPVGHLVALVKPQFEAGRGEVSQGRGIIRDPEIWARALEGVIAAMENAGATTMDLMVSPLRGAEGNVEFLAWFHRPGDLADAPDRDGPDPDRPHRLVGAAVAEAVTTFGSIGGGS
jgi:23S rRNA (cytidine1920-2'-O)/16S rRNA (cytidine1409-2'-O)-methyltransferase